MDRNLERRKTAGSFWKEVGRCRRKRSKRSAELDGCSTRPREVEWSSDGDENPRRVVKVKRRRIKYMVLRRGVFTVFYRSWKKYTRVRVYDGEKKQVYDEVNDNRPTDENILRIFIHDLPAWTITVTLQPWCSTKSAFNGASTNVPMPDPHTAIPVASALHLSK